MEALWARVGANRDEVGTLEGGGVLESELQRARRLEAKGGGSDSGPWAGLSIHSWAKAP